MNRMTVALAGAMLAAASGALAQSRPTPLRGTIVSVSGDMVHVRPAAGTAEATVTLGPKVTIAALVPSRMAAIKPGSFIGTAADTQPDGTLVAREVHVFPESMRGTGEGHRAFDLGPKSTMTNGTVGQEVVEAGGNRLTVKYKGGEKPITVPPGVPVVTFEPGGRAQLMPGAHVILFVQTGADGALSADRIVVGKDGLTPPM